MTKTAPGHRVDETVVGEVMRLHYADGLSLRAIARRMGLSRNTVRSVLGRTPVKRAVEAAKRSSIVDPYVTIMRKLLDETPEMTAPGMLERLRPLGYTGGITVLRERMTRLRPRQDPGFPVDFDDAP